MCYSRSRIIRTGFLRRGARFWSGCVSPNMKWGEWICIIRKAFHLAQNKDVVEPQAFVFIMYFFRDLLLLALVQISCFVKGPVFLFVVEQDLSWWIIHYSARKTCFLLQITLEFCWQGLFQSLEGGLDKSPDPGPSGSLGISNFQFLHLSVSPSLKLGQIMMFARACGEKNALSGASESLRRFTHHDHSSPPGIYSLRSWYAPPTPPHRLRIWACHWLESVIIRPRGIPCWSELLGFQEPYVELWGFPARTQYMALPSVGMFRQARPLALRSVQETLWSHWS